jgi:RNA recognition motif-containing protein
MDIFVGNLSFDATQEGVKKLFSDFGQVSFVTILMRKERKVPKSRGFGFVDMPDEQQALAAIAALNRTEFMGPVLDVSPARPRKEAQTEKKVPEDRVREDKVQEKPRFYPVFNKPGTYRGGRRSRSYMSQRGLTGVQAEAKPRKSSQDNPMRWRKKKGPAERPHRTRTKRMQSKVQ